MVRYLILCASLLFAMDAISQTSWELPESNLDPRIIAQEREDIRVHYSKYDSIQDFEIADLAPFDGLVKVVMDPQEGFLSKILKIREARHTIDCSYYIFTRDRVGYTLLNEIKKALERGVSIRILVDALGSPHPLHGELKALFDVTPGFMKDVQGNLTSKRATIETVLFNPVFHLKASVKRWYAKAHDLATGESDPAANMAYNRNRRSHDKILAVDAGYPDLAFVMIGGRNISEAYYGLPTLSSQTYNDLEVIVKPLPGDKKDALGIAITDYFDKLYFHLGNKMLSRSSTASYLGFYSHKIEKMNQSSIEILDNTAVKTKLQEMQKNDFLNRGFDKISLNFINEIENISRTNNSKKNGESITDHMHALMQKATSTIDIVSPYFFLYPEEIQMLQKWMDADPHRRLRIITNSIQTADNMPAQALIDNVLAPAFMKNPQWPNSRGQAQVYSFGRLESAAGNAYGKLHAKFIVVDGQYAIVGTFNGDPRSRFLNSEVGFVLNGGLPAKELQNNVDDLVRRSYLWGSPEWEKLRSSNGNSWKGPVVNFIYRWIQVFHFAPQI